MYKQFLAWHTQSTSGMMGLFLCLSQSHDMYTWHASGLKGPCPLSNTPVNFMRSQCLQHILCS